MKGGRKSLYSDRIDREGYWYDDTVGLRWVVVGRNQNLTRKTLIIACSTL